MWLFRQNSSFLLPPLLLSFAYTVVIYDNKKCIPLKEHKEIILALLPKESPFDDMKQQQQQQQQKEIHTKFEQERNLGV